MHAILYRRLRLSKELEGLIYLQFCPAIFNARSGLRDKRSPCERRGQRGPCILPVLAVAAQPRQDQKLVRSSLSGTTSSAPSVTLASSGSAAGSSVQPGLAL